MSFPRKEQQKKVKQVDNSFFEPAIENVVDESFFSDSAVEKKNPVGNGLNNGGTPSPSPFNGLSGLQNRNPFDNTTLLNTVDITTQSGAKIPIDKNKIPAVYSDKDNYIQGIQKSINDNTLTPFDADVISSSTTKNPKAATAYLQGDNTTGAAIDRVDYITKNKEQLTSIIQDYNKNNNESIIADELLADPDKLSTWAQNYQKILQRDVSDNTVGGSVYAPAGSGVGKFINQVEAKKTEYSQQLTDFLENSKPLINNHIVQSIASMDIPRDEQIKRIAQLTNPIGYANAQQALSSKREVSDQTGFFSGLGILIDEIKGGQKAENETLNSQVGYADLSLNEAYKNIANDKAAQAHLTGDENMLQQAKDIYAKVDDSVINKYPAILKSQMADEIARQIATESGMLNGTDNEPTSRLGVAAKYNGIDSNMVKEFIQRNGWDKDPNRKDAVDWLIEHPEDIKDASIFGGVVDAAIKPFKDLGLGILDAADVRGERDVITDKIKEQLFPTEFNPNETKPQFTFLGNDVHVRGTLNSITGLAGMTAIAVGTGIVGRAANLGLDALETAELASTGTDIARKGILLGKVASASERASAYTSFAIPSIDQNLKASYDNPNITNDAQRALFVSMGAILNGEGGRLLDLGSVGNVPGLPQVFIQAAKGLSEKTITKEGLSELLKKGENNFVDYAMKYATPVVTTTLAAAEKTLKGAATMAYFTASDKILKMGFGDPNAKPEDLIPDAGHAFIDGILTMIPFGFVQAVGSTNKNPNSSFKQNIYEMAQMKDATQDIFKLNNKSEADYNSKMQILNTAVAAKNVLDAVQSDNNIELNPRQRASFVANKTVEGFLRDRANKIEVTDEKTKAQKDRLLSQAEELRQQGLDTFNGLNFSKTLEPLYDLYNSENEFIKQRENVKNGIPGSEEKMLEAKRNFIQLQLKTFNNEKISGEPNVAATEITAAKIEDTKTTIAKTSGSEVKPTEVDKPLADLIGKDVSYNNEIGTLQKSETGEWVLDRGKGEADIILPVTDKNNPETSLQLGIKELPELTDEQVKTAEADKEHFGYVQSNNGNDFFVYAANPSIEGTVDQVLIKGKNGKFKEVPGIEDNTKLALVNKFLKEKGLPERDNLISKVEPAIKTENSNTNLTPEQQTVIDNIDNLPAAYKNILQAEPTAQNADEVLKNISDQWHDEQSRPTIERDYPASVIEAAKKLYPQEGDTGLKIPETKPIQNEPEPQPSSTVNKPKAANTGAGQPPVDNNTDTGTLPEDNTGISHAATEEVRKRFGLNDYERNNATDAELKALADEAIQKGYNPETLLKQMEAGIPPTGVENFILKRYLASLEATFDKDPSDANLAPIERLVKATDKIGSLQSEAFRTRKGTVPIDDSLAGFFITEKEANLGAPLTDAQKEKVESEHADITEKDKNYKEAIAKLEAENARLKAEQSVKKQSPKNTKPTSAKKTHEDFVKDRTSIIQKAKDKIQAANDKANSSDAPKTQGIGGRTYLDDLFLIAPDVLELVKSYVDEGVTNLGEIIRNIHPVLQDTIPDITERDVHDIIAGEYNKKARTKSDAAKDLYEVKLQAQLINKLERLLSGAEPKDEKDKISRNKEIESLQNQIKDFKKDNPDKKAQLKTLKTKSETELNKIEAELKAGKFAEPIKKTPLLYDSELKQNFPELHKQAVEAQNKLIKAKQERQIRLAVQQYENRSKYEKLKDQAVRYLNVPRTIMASMDYSAPLRQAVVVTVAHPGMALKAGLEMFKQSFSQSKFDRWAYDLKETPRYQLMQESKLSLTDPHSLHLQAQEEAFMGNVAEKIPIAGALIKGSERAYVSYLNKMRADLFNRYADVFEENGRTFENSPELYKGLASYINNSTGRGGLGVVETAAPILNTLLFSPRLIASRFNMLGLGDIATMGNGFYGKLPKEVRILAMKDMATFIAAGIGVLALAKLGGAQVEDDPRSSDFGKIKSGNTRWDIWGGFQPYVRVMTQVIAGERKSTNTGKIIDISSDKAKFGASRADPLVSFGRGKLAPVPAFIWDILSDRTIQGNKILFQWGGDTKDKEITLKDEAIQHFLPLIYSDVSQAVKDNGISSLFTVGVPSTFGVGVQTYAPKKK